MINDKLKKQEGGDESTNYQAETINNYGLSYRDARDIALDIFNANFLKLKTEAAEIAHARAEEILDSFLNKLENENPEILHSIKDVGMQTAIFEAQKQYAKTGDKDLADLLVDILVERAKLPIRDLKQITLEESLNVIHKLTNQQLDIITLVFLLKYTSNTNVISFISLQEYLNSHIKPFTYQLSKERIIFQHIEYTNTGSVKISIGDLSENFKTAYIGLFSKGLPKELVPTLLPNRYDKYANLFMPSLHNSSSLQLNVINKVALEKLYAEKNIPEQDRKLLTNLFNSEQMTNLEIKAFLIKQAPFMENLYDVWANSNMHNIELTSVGITIAQAYFTRKTGIKLDLSIWIKS